MMTTERKALLLDRLEQHGRIVVKELAVELDLSEDTLRRDLRALAQDGKLRRVHGGALPASPATAPFNARRGLSTEEKDCLGRHAAGLIASNQVVFLDGGTTNARLVRHLPHDLAITVVTHAPGIASALVDHPLIEVELIGGKLFKHSIVATGTVAVHGIGRVRPDLFVMGVTGLHPEEGATTGDREEAEIKALIASRAAEVMVLASTEKLNTASAHSILPLEDVDRIVLASGTAPDLCEAISWRGPEVIKV